MAEEDVYICPAGERLAYHYTNEENGMVLRRYWPTPARAAPSSTAAPPARSDGSPDGSMSTFSRRCSAGSTSIRRRCASGARRSSIPSARSRPGWEQPTSCATGCRRDGIARAGLQSHPRHEHPGRPTAHGGNEGIVVADMRPSAVAEPPKTAAVRFKSTSRPKEPPNSKNDRAWPPRRDREASMLTPERFSHGQRP